MTIPREASSTRTIRQITDHFPSLRILVVGDVMLDHYVWGAVTRISPEAPVPVVHVERETYAPGGAANVALNLAALGVDATVCGWVGDDAAGRQLGEILTHRAVSFDHAFVNTGVATIRKTRVIAQHQQVCRIDWETNPAAFDLNHERVTPLLREAVENADAVILSDYAKGAITTELAAQILEWAHAAGRLVAWDPKPENGVLVKGVDLLTPNRAEASAMANVELKHGQPFPGDQVCTKIWERYAPANVVVTLGAEGMVASRNGKVVAHIPTRARDVFDVSGAGDTVVACLTAGIAASASLEESATLANLAAGIVVGKVGTATVGVDELLAEENT